MPSACVSIEQASGKSNREGSFEDNTNSTELPCHQIIGKSQDKGDNQRSSYA